MTNVEIVLLLVGVTIGAFAAVLFWKVVLIEQVDLRKVIKKLQNKKARVPSESVYTREFNEWKRQHDLEIQMEIKDMDYSQLPMHMRQSFRQYVEARLHPDEGSFLYAVLTNNLKESFIRADETNLFTLFKTVSWCYNNLPSACWGSVQRVRDWCVSSPLMTMHEGESPESEDRGEVQ